MTQLFQTDRHISLGDEAWNEEDTRLAIREIAGDTLHAFDPEKFWPVHPLDSPGVDGMGGVYMGAAGVVLALDHLKRAEAVEYTQDFTSALPAMVERDSWVKHTPFGAYASLLMGDLGPLLLTMRLAPSAGTADRIFSRCEGNDALPPLELMWGMPGSMLACLFMHAQTNDARWQELYRRQASLLLADIGNLDGVAVWRQELYGRKMISLGLVHGFSGNMHALIKGWSWLGEAQKKEVAKIATETLAATAQRSGDLVNWPANADAPDAPMLCQICHGAPGIVTALARAPFSTPNFENLLLGGGELTWAAGPLSKGSNVCHGTGGNGYSFLALHKRTGDPTWLERARRFAAASVAQVRAARAEYARGRYALWTGDIGLACFLWDCIRAEASIPNLDAF